MYLIRHLELLANVLIRPKWIISAHRKFSLVQPERKKLTRPCAFSLNCGLVLSLFCNIFSDSSLIDFGLQLLYLAPYPVFLVQRDTSKCRIGLRLIEPRGCILSNVNVQQCVCARCSLMAVPRLTQELGGSRASITSLLCHGCEEKCVAGCVRYKRLLLL